MLHSLQESLCTDLVRPPPAPFPPAPFPRVFIYLYLSKSISKSMLFFPYTDLALSPRPPPELCPPAMPCCTQRNKMLHTKKQDAAHKETKCCTQRNKMLHTKKQDAAHKETRCCTQRNKMLHTNLQQVGHPILPT